MKISLTETPNYLTQNIDIASPLEMMRLFRQVDTQMFQGYREYPGFLDPEIEQKIQESVEQICAVLKKHQKVKIVMSGAGTSGRLAGFLAKSFRHITGKITGIELSFEYLMAGGDEALVAAKEGAEDDPFQAVLDLKALEEGADKIIYIGITCGLAAPYIAGQMEYTNNHPLYYSILLGFSTVDRARTVTIENWDKNFHQVLLAFEKGENTMVFNPVVGPEAITGSTRLKGGSATKIVGEMLIGLSLLESGLLQPGDCLDSSFPFNESIINRYLYLLDSFEKVKNTVYRQYERIAHFIHTAGDSLNHNGHIYYLGRGNMANIGIVDASECPPTFGAAFEDVRGFIENGWFSLLEKNIDLSYVDWMYRISMEDFYKEVYPGLTERDCVFILGEKSDEEFIARQAEKIRRTPAKCSVLYISPESRSFKAVEPDLYLHLPVATPGLFKGYHWRNEFALKLTVNIITTGAHILKGKIYRNRMIDLNISNNKLFHRTIHIIQTLIGAEYQTALESVLRSIYQTDNLTAEMLNTPISKHINEATGKKRVVPTALLMATGKFTYSQAREELEKDPIVRNIIKELVKKD